MNAIQKLTIVAQADHDQEMAEHCHMLENSQHAKDHVAILSKKIEAMQLHGEPGAYYSVMDPSGRIHRFECCQFPLLVGFASLGMNEIWLRNRTRDVESLEVPRGQAHFRGTEKQPDPECAKEEKSALPALPIWCVAVVAVMAWASGFLTASHWWSSP